MFYLQVIKGGYYSALARGQHARYVDLDIPRGEIFFQNKFNSPIGSGKTEASIAATNKDWFLLYAVPREIEDSETVAFTLASFLIDKGFPEDSIGEDKIYNRIKDENDPYEPIINKLDENIAKSVEDLGISGIYTKKEKLRYYPAEDLAGHILGFLGYRGDERVGQYGVEGFYDDGYLRQGKSLDLSIDYNIQFILSEKLRKLMDGLEAEGASAIVMDPKTGEIIALVILDEFNPNNYSSVENIDAFLNDATQKIFEPGSVFKPFTLAAALDSNLILPSTVYEDKGEVRIGGHTIHNSDGESYGNQTMTNVLELSLNTGAVFVQEKLGQDKFRKYIKRFRFEERTGVDLQGEVGGDIQNILNTSRDINFATASFGQGIALTPMQLITAFSAFANGGKMVRPHVVKGIVDIDGTRRAIDVEVVGNPISPKTAAQMTAMLVDVVENGWGRKAKVPGYKIAGKTGTAQVPKEDGGGYSEKTIHSFIGYAPAYNPRFIVLLKLDNPQGINFSADSVTPLFSEVAEYILNYYEIPPDS